MTDELCRPPWMDFWFLLIIALIFCASVLTAWMLSEHFRIEEERMREEAVKSIISEDAQDYHKYIKHETRKVLAVATVRVYSNESGAMKCTEGTCK